MSKCKYVVVMDGHAKIFEAKCQLDAVGVLAEIVHTWHLTDSARVTVYRLGDYLGAAVATKEWVVNSG